MEQTDFSVIMPAAGLGKRVGGSVPKPWLDLAGEPMVVRALRRFVGLPGLRKVVLALHQEEFDARAKELQKYELDVELILCVGGRRRQDTVRSALDALGSGEDEIIAIHDSARPFVPRQLILDVVSKADEGQAAIAAIPATDTIKEVDRVGFVLNTPPRNLLWQVQTPQAVRADILSRGLAVAKSRNINLTDDAQAAELMGFRVAVVPGSEINFKITTARDLAYARFLIEQGDVGS